MPIMEEISNGHFVSKICKVCTARDRHGNPLRDLIDKMSADGKSVRLIMVDLAKENLNISLPTYHRHLKLHSPWIRRRETAISSAKLNNALAMSQLEHRDAEAELQKLVDLGGNRVDKGEIQVDKDLYMFGLDRLTKHTTPVSIENLIMNFGQALAESKREVMDGEVLDK